MTTTLETPQHISRREAVAELLAGVPRRANGVRLVVTFTSESYPTTSFMDELIAQTLEGGLASELILAGADAFVRELALSAADSYGVADRLTFG